MQKKGRIKLRRFVTVLVALYIMIGSALYFFQEKLLFLPTKLEQDYTYQFNYPFEELFFETDENVSINALHFKAENPKGVILYFHGNAGDLSRWGTIVEYFVTLNYDVLIPDYRTYGKSEGKLSEVALYYDAQYCYDYLLKTYLEKDITVYGRSLGTGIASYIASKNTPKQLVLETPYYSILDVAEYRFPMFPLKKRLLKYKIPTYKYLPLAHCPITIIHGTDDAVVPFESGKKLLEVNPKINFLTIEDGKHNNLVEFDGYHKAINSVLK